MPTPPLSLSTGTITSENFVIAGVTAAHTIIWENTTTNTGLVYTNSTWMFTSIAEQEYKLTIKSENAADSVQAFTAEASAAGPPTITSLGTGTNLVENAGINQPVYTIIADTNGGGAIESYTIAGTDAGLLSVDASGVVTLDADPDYETKNAYSFTVTATNAAGPSAPAHPVIFSITNVDEVAPTITSLGTGTDLAENSGEDKTVYTITATDAVGVASYEIGGTDAGFLSVDASGVVTLDADPDYETKNAYSFTVTASDSAGNTTDPFPVIFSITNVDETAPTITSGTIGTDLVENTGANQTVYTIIASANDGGTIENYTIGGADFIAGLLEVNASGVVTLIADPDYETRNTYSFTVTASDATGISQSKTVTFDIINVNEPTDIALSKTTVNDNDPSGTLVGTLTTSDADLNDVHTYTLSGTDKDSFSIDGANLKTAVEPNIDYNNQSSYSITITTTDLSGNAFPEDFTINVIAQPSFTSSPQATVRNVGAEVTFNVDASGGGTMTFQWKKSETDISGANSSSYTISEVGLADAGYYKVYVANEAGNRTTDPVQLTVNDPTAFAETPTDIALSKTTVNDNDASGTVIGTLTTIDADPNDVHTYTLSGTDASSFSIEGATLKTVGEQPINYSTKSSFSITITTADLSGNTFQEDFTINVNNTPPTDIALSKTTVNDNDASGTVIGTLTTIDADPNDVHTYTLSGTDEGSFSIDNTVTPRVLKTAGEQPINYSTKSSFSITITTADLSGNTFQEDFTINVNNTPPTDIALSKTTVNDNDASGTVVGTLTTTDADPNDVHTYTLSGTDEGSFSIDNTVTPRVLKTAGEQPINYSTKSSFSITITTTDLSGNALSEAFTINVNNRPPTDIALSNSTVNDNDASGTVVGTLTTIDADPNDVHTYTLSGTDASSFSIEGATLKTVGEQPINYSTKSSFSITITTTDLSGNALSEAFTINVNQLFAITTQPVASRFLWLGTSPASILTVSVNINANTTYEWYHNGVAINDQYTSALQIPPFGPNLAGDYYVIATNDGTAIQSATSTVSMIELHVTPLQAVLTVGESVTFNVVTTGGGTMEYQWRKDGSDIGGANSSSYTISEVGLADADSYSVMVVNGEGQETTDPVQLTVNEPFAITTQPATTTVLQQGHTAILTVSVNISAGTTYEWYHNGGAIIVGDPSWTGQYTSVLQIPTFFPDMGGPYYVIATNDGTAIQSATSTLSLIAAPFAALEPQQAVLTVGESVTFNVVTTGGGTMEYHWKKDDLPLGDPPYSSSYTISEVGLGDAGSYSVTVWNGAGETTAGAELTVNEPFAITTQPVASRFFWDGASSSTAIFYVSVNISANTTYQWYFNGVALNGQETNGQETNALIIPSISGPLTGDYYVIATNGGTAIQSTTSTLSLIELLVTPSQATVLTVGQSVTFNVVASGGGTMNYQWQKDDSNIPDHFPTSSSYTISQVTLADAGYYSAEVFNAAAGGSRETDRVQLTVNEPFAITTQPEETKVIAPGATGTVLTVSVNISAGTTYQWYFEDSPLNGRVSRTLYISTFDGGDVGEYYVKATNGGTVIQSTPTSTLSIIEQPSFTQSSSPQAAERDVDQSVTFSVVASGGGTMTYQWKKDDSNIGGANLSSYTISQVTLADAGLYKVYIENEAGNDTTTAVQLTVNDPTAVYDTESRRNNANAKATSLFGNEHPNAVTKLKNVNFTIPSNNKATLDNEATDQLRDILKDAPDTAVGRRDQRNQRRASLQLLFTRNTTVEKMRIPKSDLFLPSTFQKTHAVVVKAGKTFNVTDLDADEGFYSVLDTGEEVSITLKTNTTLTFTNTSTGTGENIVEQYNVSSSVLGEPSWSNVSIISTQVTGTFSDADPSGTLLPEDIVIIDGLEFFIGSVGTGGTPPTDITLSNSTVNDSAESGTIVGTLTTTDADLPNNDAHIYTLSGTHATSFDISGAILKMAATTSYTTDPSYSIIITTTDLSFNTFVKSFTITVNQPSGSAGGDPYIFPIKSNTPVKLPNKEANYRLFEQNNTFINASVAQATQEHMERIIEYASKIKANNLNNLIVEGFFFDKFYISVDGNKLVIDLKKKQISARNCKKDFFKFNKTINTDNWCGYGQVTISWDSVSIDVLFFANPQIENGIKIRASGDLKNAVGLLVDNYKPKLMEIPTLQTTTYSKIHRRLAKRRNIYHKKSIVPKTEIWETFKQKKK